MNYSKQREIILETLRNNVIHPTADQVYALLHKKHPNISLATVYRNLNQLAELGIICKITGLDGSTRFDHTVAKHYHFICTKCHKVYDIPYEIAPDLGSKVEAQNGLTVESYEIALKGICHDCVKKN